MDGILKGMGARSASTESYLNAKATTVNGVTPSGDLTLFVSNPKKSIAYFSHEADRFATAAFESLITSVKSVAYPRSVAWLLIRGYYSSFFALHSLLRVRGWACTRVGKSSINPINAELSALYPSTPQLTQGLYLLVCKDGGRQLDFKKLDPGQGGTHEVLWALLPEFLNSASSIILQENPNRQEAQLVDAAIDKFVQVVKSMGGPIWFTQVRNRVNYSHAYGAWFPYVNSTNDYDRLISVFDRWKGSPTDVFDGIGNDELVKFAAACAFLVSVCNATIADLTYRSPPRSPFRTSSGLLSVASRQPAMV